MKKKTFKPGETKHPSGQYRETGKKNEITAVTGKRLPPTSKSGKRWILVDQTKHKENAKGGKK